jgi:hypothetical protein
VIKMKAKLMKTYLLSFTITISIFVIVHLLFLIRLNDFYSSSINEISKIKDSYYEIRNFENSYITKQSQEKLIYINDRYNFFEEKINLFSTKLKDRELLFFLMEIKEISLKHRESFYRTVTYVKDIKEIKDEDLYSIEFYNLQKSIELFKNQNNTFDKKIEKFTDNLNEFVKREKVKREKISFTLFLILLTLLALSLKYNLIWGDNNGYINSFKKS